MPVLKKTIMIFTLLSLSTLIWIGCSDNTVVRFVDNPTEADQTEAVELYFPLNEGYTTTYNVTYSSGNSEQVIFRAGKTVSLQGIEAVEWIGSSSNTLDTGFFYASGDALYFYASKSATPSKLLKLPLLNGTGWDAGDINLSDFTDIITGTKTDTITDPNIFSKDFPTISALNFTVEATEGVELSTGDYYSQSVRISSPNGTRKNYYWYAQGIGLVRYVIGSSTSSYPDGDVVGELVKFVN